MHPIVKHRKHISRAFLVAAIVAIILTGTYVVLSYRIKGVAEDLVNENNGRYLLSLNQLHLLFGGDP
jgi:hypothetical protein